MRILLTSSSYPRHEEDWQSRFIALMVESLAKFEGLDLELWAPEGPLPANVSQISTGADRSFLRVLSNEGGIAHLLRTRKPLAMVRAASLLTRLACAYRRSDADVAHVNWLQNALPLWGTSVPALVTVLGSDFGLLRQPGMRMALRTMLRQRKAMLAPNAEWMVSELQNEFGDIASVRTIPFGVDPLWLNLERVPHSRPRWLAVTRLTRSKIGDLFTWCDGVFGTARELHLYGPMQEDIHIPPWVNYHGPTHPAALAKAFSCATGLITLSRHDEGQPQVMLEAMAAGLPIIASDLPAHRAMVQHRVTGWLAHSARDVVDGLAGLEEAPANAYMGKMARDWVLRKVGSWDDCAGRYVQAYRDLASV